MARNISIERSQNETKVIGENGELIVHRINDISCVFVKPEGGVKPPVEHSSEEIDSKASEYLTKKEVKVRKKKDHTSSETKKKE